MKKVLVFVASLLVICGAMAQDGAKYQRSSLHMVLLTTDEPTIKDAELEEMMMESWNEYPFPDKYNNHEIDFKSAFAGKPSGGFLSFVSKYPTIESLPNDIAGLKQLSAEISEGKQYMAQLKAKVDEYIESEDLARKLVMKWYNIQPDGHADVNLLLERSAFNMSASDVNTAAATVGGAKALADQNSEELINTTFITFSKIDFYSNEPVAKFSCNLAKKLANLTAQLAGNPIATAAAAAAEVAADKAYEMNKDGYSAKATTMLYKLKWNDSIMYTFYDAWKEDGTIDMEKFNAMHFEMEYLGADDCTTSSGASASFGGKVKEKRDLVHTTMTRNLDKQLVNLQNNYEVFRPVAQIISTEPMLADMGTKEGLKGGEKFELLIRAADPKTGKMFYKSIGTVSVDKKGVWDNNFDMTDGAATVTPSPVQTADGKNGTVISKNKKALPGMVIRQVGGKKKK